MPNDYHITDHFTVMDTSEKSVFLYVSDNKVANPVGNLFVSDGLGYRFTHSLDNIIKGGRAVDFETVESLDGTFIANKYDTETGKKKKSEGNNIEEGKIRETTEEDIKKAEEAKEDHSKMQNNPEANKK